MWQASPFCQNSISATQNASQYLVWPPRACMHAWQLRGMLLMRRRMVSCGMSSQICLRTSVSSCKVWGATWRRLMDRNIMSQRCSIGFRSGDREGHSIVSIPSSSRYCLHTHMRPGIVVHQEEPRTYCTSVGSDHGFKDFIPIPNGSQTAVL